MRNIKQKFVITSDEFRMGRSVFHKDLIRGGGEDAIGGGSWYWDKERDTLYLYGESYDFGPVTKEDIEKNMSDIKRRYFKNSNVIFESNSYKTLLEILSENMCESRAKLLISQNDFI